MHTASSSRVVHAPKSAVWAVLDDFGAVSAYNPNVASSRIVNDIERGAGARRECVFDDGGRIEETIVDYHPDEQYTVEFTDVGSYPLVSNVVTIAVRAIDDHHTEATFTAAFSPKYGPIGWLMARMMMVSAFEKRFDEVLAGLAAYVRARDVDATPGVATSGA